ncbi:hypothetical protein L218DRAFT_952689 [Marasmius fiardii PR-910]|nr:hypothetical protein L218DRAFT_952689 [Marasmius fiardii PR-910]
MNLRFIWYMTFASCIEELCGAFTSATRMNDNFNHRLSQVLSTPGDGEAAPCPPNSSTANHTLYVKSASEWLLKNLHNPFPSIEFRDRLCLIHDCPRKNIDAWFNEARKRIGWNSIRKKHFSTRKQTIDAASSFFFLRCVAISYVIT